MYAVKNAVFNYLTKNQKSSLCAYLRSFIKRCEDLSADEILDEFIEDETCFEEAGSAHFHFAVENFSNEEFIKDLKIFIKAAIKDMEYRKNQKEVQKPIIEAQKKYMKEQRKRAQEYKMAQEKPTAKQLKYYKSLCKDKNVEPKELDGVSKLDLRDWIAEIANDTEEN